MADLTVNTLLISESVALLRLVPVNNQTVAECQSCSAIGSTVIHISSTLCLEEHTGI